MKSRTVLDCLGALNRVASKHTVELHWTKAHVSHYGNELADGEAKAGTLQQAKSGKILPTKAHFKKHLKANSPNCGQHSRVSSGGFGRRKTLLF